MGVKTDKEKGTQPGNYFVSNYPPFSQWTEEHVGEARDAISRPPDPNTPLGLYMHIPFCRKRCRFCYFRVYTDKNANQIEQYIQAMLREIELYSNQPVLRDRALQFVYFGGGTPSYLSDRQLHAMVDRIRKFVSWDDAEEVTFECEPGTLQERKLRALKDIGVTRLSLGVENFSDAILEENGRAHLSPEVDRAYGWARDIGFDQINIDLIAGMVGETWDNWRECVRRALNMKPDSLTIYQMELPYNTGYAKQVKEGDGQSPVADWKTKRAWVDYAFNEFQSEGYDVSSAYTLVRDKKTCRFVYRDAVWHGADMLGTGVASFSHVGGVHYQNLDNFDDYIEQLERGELPVGRAMSPTPHQLLIRELILQLKTGRVESKYFRNKFQVEIGDAFTGAFERLASDEYLCAENDGWRLTRKGLLQADALLPEFFEPEHRGIRYT